MNLSTSLNSVSVLSNLLGIPTEGLVFLVLDDMTDIIGELITIESLSVIAEEYRSLFSGDGINIDDIETIVGRMAISEYLNDGGELIGNAERDIWLVYVDGTDVSILRKAYKAIGVTYPENPYALKSDGTAALKSDGTAASQTL